MFKYTITGKRVPFVPEDQFEPLQPGEYGQTKSGIWYARPPDYPDMACLGDGVRSHKVTDHEDGTITVTPSILINNEWHGYLTRGVWCKL